MVHKTSFRGVHSGNTLRSSCLYTRRYHQQACIICRVRPELLRKLASENAADKQVEMRNVAVNVALSLNKQSRWLLPPALIRQIRSNDLSQPGLTVSLLERHKLKRPANCVSFHSNSGEVRSIKPRNGRHFGFNYLTADGKSRRALRREKRERLKLRDVVRNIEGKTVEVFTEQGRVRGTSQVGESEIQYEVFYPSPVTSSISHNPKYIKQDVHVAPGDASEHVLHGKPKKQHRGKQRKRMSLKDVDDCDLPSYQKRNDSFLDDIEETADYEDCPSCDDVVEQQRTQECLLSCLLEKAERLQSMMRSTKSRRKKQNKSANSCENDKSHIIYAPELQNTNTEESKTEAKASAELEHQLMFVAPTEVTRVLLPCADVSMESLVECCGDRYFEAACIPRKFVLDVTPSVRDVMKKQGVAPLLAERTNEAISYLVFIHDGFYDDTYDVYKVLLNSRLHQGLLSVDEMADDSQNLNRSSVMNVVSKTMDFVEGMVTKLKEQSNFPSYFESTGYKADGRLLKHHLGSAEAYVPSVQRMFKLGSSASEVILPPLADMLQEEPAFCDICYEDVSPLTMDSVPATALLRCRHRICDTCWAQHISSRLQQGFVRVTCPGFDCQEDVKVGVLLSLATVDTVDKLLQRQEEVRISASQTEKWCPNESCGRVIHLHASSAKGLQQDVVCACGTHVCFECLMPAHWPASCKQAEDYRTNLANMVFPDRLAEVHDDDELEQATRLQRELEKKKTMLVEGKHCPKCRTFVFKNGGCPQMVCRCGQLFCWFCAKKGYSHPSRIGCVNAEEEKKLTTTVIVHHLSPEKSQAEKNAEEQKKSTANRRQRVSLMERAAEHRRHQSADHQHVRTITVLARAVAAAAFKDKDLSQRVVSVCTGMSLTSSHKPHLIAGATVPTSRTPNVVEVVSAFLKRMVRTQKELHEVIEYSLVLLKDLPDSILKRRAFRISEDLGAFCSYVQSVFDAWSVRTLNQGQLQEAVKAVMKLAEIHGWIHSGLDTHVITIRKLRNTHKP